VKGQKLFTNVHDVTYQKTLISSDITERIFILPHVLSSPTTVVCICIPSCILQDLLCRQHVLNWVHQSDKKKMVAEILTGKSIGNPRITKYIIGRNFS